MPPRVNDKTTAGPAYFAAATPVSTKMPAPMIAPTPRVVRLKAESARRRPASCSVASACSCAIVFLAKSGFMGLSLSRDPQVDGRAGEDAREACQRLLSRPRGHEETRRNRQSGEHVEGGQPWVGPRAVWPRRIRQLSA